MTLFNLTAGCGKGSGTSGGQTYKYDYSIRSNNVNNNTFLRNGGGRGVFSNIAPDVIPTNAQLDKMVVSGSTTETDEFTAEVYENGLLIYSLVKPSGNQSIVQLTGMPVVNANSQISVRISNLGNTISHPKVSLFFTEVL